MYVLLLPKQVESKSETRLWKRAFCNDRWSLFFTSDGNQYIRQTRGERLIPKYVKLSVSYSRSGTTIIHKWTENVDIMAWFAQSPNNRTTNLWKVIIGYVNLKRFDDSNWYAGANVGWMRQNHAWTMWNILIKPCSRKDAEVFKNHVLYTSYSISILSQ